MYVDANPVNRIDPEGLFEIEVVEPHIKHPIHERITEEALRPMGFTEERLNQIKHGVLAADLVFTNLPAQHFDTNKRKRENVLHGFAFVRLLRTKTIQVYFHPRSAERPGILDAAYQFGRLLHAAQDFYSHSNYVNLLGEYFPGGLDEFERLPQARVPLYEELVTSDTALAESGLTGVLPDRLISGIFPDTDAGPGEISHAQLNKDAPNRPYHFEARTLAVKQTKREWEKLMSAMREEINLLLSDKAQQEDEMNRFLREFRGK